MTVLAWISGVIGIIYLWILLVHCRRTGHILRALTLTVGSGLCGLLILNLTARFTGVSLGINPWTVGTAASFGLPGIAGLLFLRLFF